MRRSHELDSIRSQKLRERWVFRKEAIPENKQQLWAAGGGSSGMVSGKVGGKCVEAATGCPRCLYAGGWKRLEQVWRERKRCCREGVVPGMHCVGSNFLCDFNDVFVVEVRSDVVSRGPLVLDANSLIRQVPVARILVFRGVDCDRWDT